MHQKILTLTLAFLLAACGSEATPEPTSAAPAEAPAEPTPALPTEVAPTATEAPSVDAIAAARELGALAHAIDAEPARASALLTERTLEPAAFERRLFEVAADPELTRLYLEARAASN